MTEHVVIMAGGVGSRLYPLSTPERPKQFLDLLGAGRTLIQLTYQRFLSVNPDAEFWVVTSEKYTAFVREQLPAVPADHILAEPASRNTAPCIAYACWKIKSRFQDANIVVTPADAYIPDAEAFASTIRSAMDFTASRRAIVCVGIKPSSPNTEYGYIHAGERTEGSGIIKVESFKEKPSLEVAQRYYDEGGYFWNAGIFVWNISTIENEIRTHAPQIAAVMDAIAPSLYTSEEKAVVDRLFPTCEKISIDYAVMEKSPDVYVAEALWKWSDLGSFEAIEAVTGRKIER